MLEKENMCRTRKLLLLLIHLGLIAENMVQICPEKYRQHGASHSRAGGDIALKIRWLLQRKLLQD
jgi:hypothetical protein